MIKVTRFNQTEFVINSDLIEFVEQTPDTVITMTTGRKVLVRESADEIINRVIHFRREAGNWISPAANIKTHEDEAA